MYSIAELCQKQITLFKRNPSKIFTSDKDITYTLDDIVSLTSLLMSNSDNIKTKYNKQICERLDNSCYLRHNKLQMIAVDHSTEKYSYPLCFNFPISTPNIRDSYSSIIKLLLKDYDENLYSLFNLNTIVAELVRNSFNFGRYEFNVGQVKRSVRGLQLKVVNDSYLELSYFDSGQGISDVEYCVQRGNTTTKALGEGRGFGWVFESISNYRGTFEITTKSNKYTKDFNLNPFKRDTVFLFDNKFDIESVEGVAITIKLPLDKLLPK